MHEDAVARQHGGKPVRDHERRAIGHQPGQRRLHQRLAFRIERGCRLVEQQERRVAQDRARDGDALALTAGQRHAALADLRVVALRQAADELGRRRHVGGALDIGIRRAGPPEADILAHGSREDRGILRHQRDARAQGRRIGVGDRNAVETDKARGRIVEAQDQMEDRALAGARRTDDRDLLAGCAPETTRRRARRHRAVAG